MGLKAETEGFIMPVQDQSLFTRNYQSKIVKNGTDPICRFCDQYDETIDHLVSGCHILTPNEYRNRHDRVGQYLHLKICNHYNTPHAEKWYERKTPLVVEGENTTMLWDFPIIKDKTIQAKGPDIVIKDYKSKTCLFIETGRFQQTEISL